MKALVFNDVKQPLALQERPGPKAGKVTVFTLENDSFPNTFELVHCASPLLCRQISVLDDDRGRFIIQNGELCVGGLTCIVHGKPPSEAE